MITLGFENPPNVMNWLGSGTIIPEFLNEINAMNSPSPTVPACLMDTGISLMMDCLNPENDRAINSNEDTNTADKAVSHGIPIPNTTENAKKAFIDIHGAIPNGNLA